MTALILTGIDFSNLKFIKTTQTFQNGTINQALRSGRIWHKVNF